MNGNKPRKPDAERLLIIAKELDLAERVGQLEDKPEGVRFILLSDTFAQFVAERLREIADRM